MPGVCDQGLAWKGLEDLFFSRARDDKGAPVRKSPERKFGPEKKKCKEWFLQSFIRLRLT